MKNNPSSPCDIDVVRAQQENHGNDEDLFGIYRYIMWPTKKDIYIHMGNFGFIARHWRDISSAQ